MEFTWQEERNNWSTTASSEFRPGEGWSTVPAGALTPDCEPSAAGVCGCNRSAGGWVGPDRVAAARAKESQEG